MEKWTKLVPAVARSLEEAGLALLTFYSLPGFWLGLMFILLFSRQLGWFPAGGWESADAIFLPVGARWLDRLHHLALPVATLVLGGFMGTARYLRSALDEVLAQDYILAARARGLSESRVVLGHALRNALLPVITILGLSIPGLIGGSVIFETIFAIPGMGKLFYDGVMMRDYPLIMGILVMGAVLTLLGNLIADVSYALADPRIRKS